jgi:hypothetical protein
MIYWFYRKRGTYTFDMAQDSIRRTAKLAIAITIIKFILAIYLNSVANSLIWLTIMSCNATIQNQVRNMSADFFIDAILKGVQCWGFYAIIRPPHTPGAKVTCCAPKKDTVEPMPAESPVEPPKPGCCDRLFTKNNVIIAFMIYGVIRTPVSFVSVIQTLMKPAWEQRTFKGFLIMQVLGEFATILWETRSIRWLFFLRRRLQEGIEGDVPAAQAIEPVSIIVSPRDVKDEASAPEAIETPVADATSEEKVKEENISQNEVANGEAKKENQEQ